MQGIYVDGRRPASKKAVREAALDDPERVYIEATSLFGNEYNGPLADWQGGSTIYFVGPDPYNKRNFYGQINRGPKGITVK